jgi:hypothetical protein
MHTTTMQNFITIGSVVYERIEDKQTNKQTNKHTCLFYIYRFTLIDFIRKRKSLCSFIFPNKRALIHRRKHKRELSGTNRHLEVQYCKLNNKILHQATST